MSVGTKTKFTLHSYQASPSVLNLVSYFCYFPNSQLLTQFSDTTHIVGNVLNIIFTSNVLCYNMSWFGFLDDVSWTRRFHFILVQSYTSIIPYHYALTFFSPTLVPERSKKLCCFDVQKLSKSNLKSNGSFLIALCVLSQMYFYFKHVILNGKVESVFRFSPVLLSKLSPWFPLVYLTIRIHRISDPM